MITQTKTQLKAAMLIAAAALAGCSTENYETGDGKYSYLRADFVEVHADADKRIDYIDTDYGERLYSAEPFTISWIEKGDTIYRTLLYYNRVESETGEYEASAVSARQVPVCAPIPQSSFSEVLTDPVTFESAWLSANKRYINISFDIKTGQVDDNDTKQTLSVVDCGETTLGDGRRCAVLRLYHDQGGVPEYYSVRRYVSIRTSAIDADVVRIQINAYSGEVTKDIELD